MRAWIAIACAAALVSTARADKDHLVEARQHFQRGMTSYDLGEWDGAIAEFKIAYELSHAPALLFNLAQSHRHKKNWELAAHFYRTYLELVPDAPNRADAQKYLAGVEAERARAAAIAPPPSEPAPKPAEPAPKPSEVEPRLEFSVNATPELSTAAAPAPAAPRRPRARSLLIGGAVTVAVGVVVLAVGAYFAAASAADADSIAALSRRGGAWTPDYAATFAEGQRDAPVGTALLATGGAIAAAGIAVAAIGAVRRARGRFALAPAAGAWGLAVRCGF